MRWIHWLWFPLVAALGCSDMHRPPRLVDFGASDGDPLPGNVKETVTCLFKGASSTQICTADTGDSCSGVGSCQVAIAGQAGTQVSWTSTCGATGARTTTLDGADESISFACGSATVSETVSCVFSSGKSETCATSQGDTCTGVGSCQVKVSGQAGTKLTWKSSCGDSQTSILDGIDETLKFSCSTIKPVSETVTCYFSSKNSETCVSDQGHTCSGVGSCQVKVSGVVGTKLMWKSSCGSSNLLTTVIDGVDESIKFACSSTVVWEAVTCYFSSSQVETCGSTDAIHWCSGVGSCVAKVSGTSGTQITWKSSCGGGSQTTTLDGIDESIKFACGSTTVSEAVTCVFTGATGTQTCTASDGSTCTGVGTCQVKVSGTSGTQLTWKSTCGGYQYSTLDGTDEKILFKCGPTTVSEAVTCYFSSSKMETCGVAGGTQGCSGVGSCVAKVSGTSGTQLTWKSSCGGYQYTTLDGIDESIKFACGQTTVSEAVTCVFSGTSGAQTCTASDGSSCSGYGLCQVKVSGTSGTQLTWKSTCGGYQYTTLDGIDESIKFACGQTTVSEAVTCVFSGGTGKQSCTASDGSTCTGVGTCQVKVSGTSGTQLTWKSTCGGYQYTTLDGLDEKIQFTCGSTTVTEAVTCTFKSTKTETCYDKNGSVSCSGIGSCTLKLSGTAGTVMNWTSTCGGSAQTILDGKDETIAFTCGTSTMVTEIVTCYFSSLTSQTCYASDGSTCTGVGSCQVKMSGTAGTQVSWKSSCGGYASTILDGADESIKFACSP